MILYRSNFNLDVDLLDGIIEKVNGNEERLGKDGMYTTYFTEYVEEREEVIFAPHYKEAIGEGLSALGLQHRCSYVFDHWMQVYGEGNTGHDPHDHYCGKALVSWIHFVRPTSTKAMYFMDSDLNKTYPEQNQGDFIMFSPWMLHGVDPTPPEDARAIIAGNVYIKELVCPSNDSINLYYTFEGETSVCRQIDAVL